jgi:hypothetical protein
VFIRKNEPVLWVATLGAMLIEKDFQRGDDRNGGLALWGASVHPHGSAKRIS